jgi:hypothetical protein
MQDAFAFLWGQPESCFLLRDVLIYHTCPDLPRPQRLGRSVWIEHIVHIEHIEAHRLPFQEDAEGGSFADFGLFDEYFSFMILFNDPAGKTQSQAPPSFFGGEPGFKNTGNILFDNSFPGICYIDRYIVSSVLDIYYDGAFSLHCIQCIF